MGREGWGRDGGTESPSGLVSVFLHAPTVTVYVALYKQSIIQSCGTYLTGKLILTLPIAKHNLMTEHLAV